MQGEVGLQEACIEALYDPVESLPAFAQRYSHHFNLLSAHNFHMTVRFHASALQRIGFYYIIYRCCLRAASQETKIRRMRLQLQTIQCGFNSTNQSTALSMNLMHCSMTDIADSDQPFQLLRFAPSIARLDTMCSLDTYPPHDDPIVSPLDKEADIRINVNLSKTPDGDESSDKHARPTAVHIITNPFFFRFDVTFLDRLYYLINFKKQCNTMWYTHYRQHVLDLIPENYWLHKFDNSRTGENGNIIDVKVESALARLMLVVPVPNLRLPKPMEVASPRPQFRPTAIVVDATRFMLASTRTAHPHTQSPVPLRLETALQISFHSGSLCFYTGSDTTPVLFGSITREHFESTNVPSINVELRELPRSPVRDGPKPSVSTSDQNEFLTNMRNREPTPFSSVYVRREGKEPSQQAASRNEAEAFKIVETVHSEILVRIAVPHLELRLNRSKLIMLNNLLTDLSMWDAWKPKHVSACMHTIREF